MASRSDSVTISRFRNRAIAVAAVFVSTGIAAAACGNAQPTAGSGTCASATASIVVQAPAAECSCPEPQAPSPLASASAATSSSAAQGAAPGICPDDMALVQGDYCPLVEQACLERGKNAAGEDNEAVCLKFEKPSTCLSAARVPMRYCMDRYEYPNKEGELPRVLVTWEEASRLCKQQDKRICSESEFNFACEGPEMLPYSYGYERDPAKCNVDKPYRNPDGFAPRSFNDCMRDKHCKEGFEALDQRLPIGSNPECVSPFGIHDLNGNANEWVILRYKQPPNRSALKGGWWGPVRGRCRPIVSHHDERYLGYEVGFRCCSKPLDEAAAAPKKGRRGRMATRVK